MPGRSEANLMTRRSILGALFLALIAAGPAVAAPLQSGIAAYNARNYAAAARIFLPLAERGDPRAQTYLGFMYANGRGLAQSYVQAARWFNLASEQGIPTAQFMLGLMFDKGHGVPQDYVLAYKWINLAVARGNPRERQYWVKIRDAVSSKLTLVQITEGQRWAVEWQAERQYLPAPPPIFLPYSYIIPFY
jgi:hypothetical protein